MISDAEGYCLFSGRGCPFRLKYIGNYDIIHKIRLMLRVFIPFGFSREEIIGIFAGMDEVETFEVI